MKIYREPSAEELETFNDYLNTFKYALTPEITIIDNQITSKIILRMYEEKETVAPETNPSVSQDQTIIQETTENGQQEESTSNAG